MNKKYTFALLVLILIFTCAFDMILSPDEQTPEEGSDFDIPIAETEEEEEPAFPGWIDIDEDQAEILEKIYTQMTDTGKARSGWFSDGDYAPCSWNGISCEYGRVTGLNFENAGYFPVFPKSILELKDLKELRMSDTLLRGPLPTSLFSDLQKLEKLELSGNFFSGEIPDLPSAFEGYPMLSEIVISDNLEDGRKSQLLFQPEYADTAASSPDPGSYPGTDLTPGIDGSIPTDWDRLPNLTKIDLSNNTLTGSVPDSFLQLPLSELDLSGNGAGLDISGVLYDHLASMGNPYINLDGLLPPIPTEEPIIEEPTEVPTEEPIYWEPTEEPIYQEPTEEPVYWEPTEEFTYIDIEPTEERIFQEPTEIPTAVQTHKEPTPEPTQGFSDNRWINPPDEPTLVPPEEHRPEQPTREPQPQVNTATPVPQWYTPTPIPWQQYQYPTQEPYYPQPGPNYPQPGPNNPQPGPYYPPSQPNEPPYYVYPTATPYTYTGPIVYNTPTVQNSYVNPGAGWNESAALGFTYIYTEMTENNIPMTWWNTGMVQYSINYLDANDNLYPAFAMEWTPASLLCNDSTCSTSVTNIPEDLLRGGTFSLQLRAQDPSGHTIISEPVKLQVSIPEPTATPMPEEHHSVFLGFLRWLFSPIIRLFSGR